MLGENGRENNTTFLENGGVVGFWPCGEGRGNWIVFLLGKKCEI
jgi:hypothetical protein